MTTVPHGMRLNNPFNIIFSQHITWQGQTGNDGHFCEFDTSLNGLRAGVINTCNHVIKDGMKPDLDHLIGDDEHGQAPPVENDTASYIGYMCGIMGVEADADIDIHDKETMEYYARGVVDVEQGHEWSETITDDEIAEAVEQAFEHLYGAAS